MVFNVVPTALEVVLVAGVLAYKGGPALAGLTLATLGAYAAFTLSVTSWRTQARARLCVAAAARPAATPAPLPNPQTNLQTLPPQPSSTPQNP